MPETNDRLTALTAGIVGAYVSRHATAVAEIPGLMRTVRDGLAALDAPAASAAVQPASPAQIRASIRPDALISFEDGRPYKALRRHLTMRGISPEQYRAKWGLPVDYPLVSATYSARRSEISKAIGLGGPIRRVQQAAE